MDLSASLVDASSSPLSAGSSTAVADGTPILQLEDSMRNDVSIMQANHQQVKSRQLSSLEKFFVNVAEVYQHQTLQKHAEEQAVRQENDTEIQRVAASSKSESGSQVSGSGIPASWPFARMENKLFMARYQVDNIVHTIEQLLKGAGQRGMANVQATQQQPPVLTLAERNTDMYMQKMTEQAAVQKDQQSMDKEAAATAAAAGDSAMSDDSKQPSGEDAPLSADDELAEFLHDEEAEDGAGDEVSTIADQTEASAGGVSLATRRDRLGTLLMLKRRQYTKAKDVLMNGIDEMRKAIESERKYLEGVGELAKYWTVRTVPNDAAAAVHLPSTPAAAAAHAAAQQGKGPQLNPYQNGLPAGFTTAYPSLMIDYRIGTLDISLDRGKAWLYRNDAGDVFVDEALGKEPEVPKPSSSAPIAPAAATATKLEADEEVKEGDTTAATPAAAATTTAAAPLPSWMVVSARLQRAQHQLLYKHLYNTLMIEARDLRIASHKEQLKASSQSFNMHAAGGVGAASASSPSAASSSAAAFLPPPSSHTARPWTVLEITPRRIQIDVLGFQEGITIEWQQGISAPFQIKTTRLNEPTPLSDEVNSATLDPSQLPLHLSHLLCNQSLCILLDHTLKNSLGSRKTLEHLIDDASAAAMRRDHAVMATGTGLSGTGQEESCIWPTRAPSMVQFIVMAVNHWRVVREVREAVRRVQMKQRTTAATATVAVGSTADAVVPPFRIKIARTKQPYIYSFTVTVRKSFVLDCTIRGLNFQVLTRLPPAVPAASIYSTFGQPAPMISLREHNVANYSNAETIECNSAQQFEQILTRALRWHM